MINKSCSFEFVGEANLFLDARNLFFETLAEKIVCDDDTEMVFYVKKREGSVLNLLYLMLLSIVVNLAFFELLSFLGYQKSADALERFKYGEHIYSC